MPVNQQTPNVPLDQSNPMAYIDYIRQMLPDYFNQSIDAGQRAQPGMEQGYNDMQDPAALIKRLGAGYQESPGFQFNKQQGLAGIQNAASAGGMLGTPQHQQQAGILANNLANQEYNQYLEKALGEYNMGTAGKADIFNQGTKASQGLGEDLSSVLANQGGLSFWQKQNSEKDSADRKAMWLKLLLAGSGTAAGGYFGGLTGAQAGAAAGTQLAGAF